VPVVCQTLGSELCITYAILETPEVAGEGTETNLGTGSCNSVLSCLPGGMDHVVLDTGVAMAKPTPLVSEMVRRQEFL
jgi:hypothetical protein